MSFYKLLVPSVTQSLIHGHLQRKLVLLGNILGPFLQSYIIVFNKAPRPYSLLNRASAVGNLCYCGMFLACLYIYFVSNKASRTYSLLNRISSCHSLLTLYTRSVLPNNMQYIFEKKTAISVHFVDKCRLELRTKLFFILI